MTIGIIGAMEMEIAKLKECISTVSVKNMMGLDFYVGTLYGSTVVVVRAGIGKVNAALCTQLLIDHYAADMVINTGVAGAVEKDMNIGDIVISDDAVQHDFDTSPLGDEVGFISGIDVSSFKADDELIRRAYEAVGKLGFSAHIGRIASGDKFINTPEEKDRIWKLFKAKCCEMEGGAIAHACWLNKIPFVIVRVISDTADEGSGVNYETFCAEAAQKATNIVIEMIKGLE